MKILEILWSARICNFRHRSSNFLHKQQSVSACASVSARQFQYYEDPGLLSVNRGFSRRSKPTWTLGNFKLNSWIVAWKISRAGICDQKIRHSVQLWWTWTPKIKKDSPNHFHLLFIFFSEYRYGEFFEIFTKTTERSSLGYHLLNLIYCHVAWRKSP